MRQDVKSFIKNSGVFFIGSVLSKVIIFLLLPLYTHNISTESYGYYDLSVAYVTVFTSLLYFDIWATVLRFMYDTDDLQRKKQIISTCWLIFIASSTLYLIIGGILCKTFVIQYGVLILGYGLSVNLHNMCGFVARGWKKNLHFAISGILNTLVMVVGNLIMILCWDFGIVALYVSAILGNVTQSLYLIAFANAVPPPKRFRMDHSLLLSIGKYTLPLCINSISYWLLTSYNRTVIESILGLSGNGIYAIGNKFGAAISLITTCFTYAWQEIAFSRQKNQKENGVFYGKACGCYFVFLSIGIAFLLPGFVVLFPVLIGENFTQSYNTIPIFLIMAGLSAFSTFIGNIFYAIKDTRTIFTTMLASCILNLVLCRIMILSFGINGANLSICISFALNILLRYMILNKKINFSTPLKQFLLPSLLVVCSSLLFIKAPVWLNIAYLFALMLISLAIFLKQKKRRSHAL